MQENIYYADLVKESLNLYILMYTNLVAVWLVILYSLYFFLGILPIRSIVFIGHISLHPEMLLWWESKT